MGCTPETSCARITRNICLSQERTIGEQPHGLARLEAQVAQDLAYANYPIHNWVPTKYHSSGEPVLDVVVIGGGMNGQSIGFALLQQRITNFRILDRNPPGREGPWLTYARMRELRTPKEMIGPDLGFPSLSFSRWFQAKYGVAAWNALSRAPNEVWMDYLNWFRRILNLPIENNIEVENIQPEGDFFRLNLDGGRQPGALYARRVVLATGFLGAGGAFVPDFVRHSLPPQCFAHSADPIDFTRLGGKRIAVIGAGASAFDNAAVALEAGAASVDLFARRTEVEHRNFKETTEFSNFLRHYRELDDSRRWRMMINFVGASAPPPRASIERCRRHATFNLHTGSRVTKLEYKGDTIRLATASGEFDFDFLIAATGFSIDLQRRRELRDFVEAIALWKDVYTPPQELGDEGLLLQPYLGNAFQYCEKEPGRAPFLARLHDFGIGAVQSMGPVCVGLNGMQYGVQRLVAGISSSLFCEDAELHESAMQRLCVPKT